MDLLLERLLKAPGVPGRETRIRDEIRSHIESKELFDEIRVDSLGSLIAVRYPRVSGCQVSHPQPSQSKPVRVLLSAHMDQIGFLVSHISDGGFLRLHPVGAFDNRQLFSRAVVVETDDGELLSGILHPEVHPVHTADPKESNEVPSLKHFFVDLCLPESTVRSKIRLGNMVVFDEPIRRLGNAIACAGLDNRAGCWALVRAMELLSKHDCEIHAVWSVQEELGSRGAEPVSFAIKPDIGISCDTTVCCETPGVREEERVTEFGKGVAIQIADSSTLSDMSLVNSLERVATDRGIACQRSLMIGGGQDGARIQTSNEGVRTIVLSCPVKYLHTACEVVHEDDLHTYSQLIAAYLETL